MTRTFPLILAIAAAGCVERSDASVPVAGLSLVDSLVLVESAATYVASPTHLAASATRGLFITDAFARTVIHVAPDGAVDGVVGRRGRGPGEFESPSTLLVAHDSLLFVADQARGGVVVRDLVAGTERGILRIEGNRPTMTLVGDTIYAGTVNTMRGTALASWSTGGDSVRYFGELPAAFLRSPLRQFVYNVSLAAWRDTLAYVVGISDVVYIATSDGQLTDSVRVPRATRRGIPGEARLASFRDPGALAAGTSIPWALGALRDGRLVVVFADGEMRQTGLAGRLYATVISRGTGTSCADLPIPSDGHELPRITFVGDRMLVLEQRLVGGKAVSVVRRYAFPDGCGTTAA